MRLWFLRQLAAALWRHACGHENHALQLTSKVFTRNPVDCPSELTITLSPLFHRSDRNPQYAAAFSSDSLQLGQAGVGESAGADDCTSRKSAEMPPCDRGVDTFGEWHCEFAEILLPVEGIA